MAVEKRPNERVKSAHFERGLANKADISSSRARVSQTIREINHENLNE